jgi:hypothetical protein
MLSKAISRFNLRELPPLADIRDIMRLKPVEIEIDGFPLKLARPTIMDLIEALQVNATRPEEGRAWLLHRHLLDDLDLPVFCTLNDAKSCPAHIAAPAIVAIERLYNEGRD